jgi:thiol-disulfide isomerase/thioredoxin
MLLPRRSRSTWRGLVAAVALGAALLVTGCDADTPGARATEPAPPFQSCPVGVTASGPAISGAGQPLPDVALPCFTGGASVVLSKLGRPAVINLWASWCGPCRAELPEFQRLADRAGANLLVLGVVTGDTRGAASSLATDLGISFPALFDESGQLQRGVASMALPVTLFVDAGGELRHVDKSGVLTLVDLTQLTGTHLGVVVS